MPAAMPPPIALSKTKLMSFRQCPRKLWLEQYSPELEEEDAIDWAAIETGRAVGDIARQIYGAAGGHRVSNERGLRAAVAETGELLAAGGDTPLFEASFDHDGLTVQVDVLDRSGGALTLLEVKSATSVKDHYVHDCAIQSWTLTEAGFAPTAVRLVHIDSTFTYAGDGDYRGLLIEQDLTEQVAALQPEIRDLIGSARATLGELDEPERPIGAHCTTPYRCQFFDHCAPPQGQYPVTGLGGRKEALYELMRDGFEDLRDVPEDRLSNDRQRLIRRQTIAGTAYVGTEIGRTIRSLEGPRYFVDFETISFAIPIWPDTQPYEQLLFQWSCHIDNGELEHHEFLDLTGEPPMRRAAEALLETLGTTGPVVVYSGFEGQVLERLAARFSDLADALQAVAGRLFDLHALIRNDYYHPDMHGSWSIKSVLPTIAPDLDYGELGDIQDGLGAQRAYLEAIDPGSSPERRDALAAALKAYCQRDTLGMIKLTEFFTDS